MELSRVKIGLTATAIALGCCAGATYLVLKYRHSTQDAATAFKYLQIEIVSTVEDCDRVAGELKRKSEQHSAIGFDCEWVTEKGSRHPVALMQLSTLDGYCGLFRLSHLKTVPNSLKIMKDHSSHDVVLLCVECHKRSNMRDRRVRTELAVMCDAPLTSGANSKYVDNVDVKRVKSAARALLHQSKKHVLPDARRRELETVVLQHYPGQQQLTEDLLEEAASLQDFIENASYEAHGDKVVAYFLSREGPMRLEEIWREHFLSSMRPRHMPPLWSVRHNEERMRVRYETGRLTEEDLKMLGLTKWIN